MAGPNMDQFEAYFRRADLDGDGRISGTEAVSFFQGSNLPKPVLAQIWNYADQAKSGFLGRNEFYNALKLVTVAQSKRDLTPDIVKAALYGPAAAKIPAPQINLAALPPPQQRPIAPAASMPQMGVTGPTSSQGFGYRGQGFSGPVANPQYFPSQQGLTMRPPQAMAASSAPPPANSDPLPASSAPLPASSTPRPQQGFSGPDMSREVSMVGHGLSSPSITNDWNSGRTGAFSASPGGMTPSVALPTSTSTPRAPVSPMPQPTTVNSKALAVSGNGFSSNSVLGNDSFSAFSSTPKQGSAGQNYSVSSVPVSSAIVPVSSGAQPAAGQNYSVSSVPVSSAIVPVSSGAQPASKQSALDSLQSSFSMQPVSSQFQRAVPTSNTSQQIPPPASSPYASSGISVGLGNTSSDSAELSWPKMKPSDVQKYAKVFMEVDSDRDGKITGEQARSLFFSWRLPIDVLKKVWDLSDQDNDSMLSLKEFCFALYLMERYREGCTLPLSLPNNVLYDETLLSMLGQPKVPYGNAAWGIRPGFQPQQGVPGARQVAPAAGLRPPVQETSVRADGPMHPNQQKPGAAVLDDSVLNNTDKGEQLQQAANAGKKADETENVILDSKEKIELYRNKMQELVLYKSRCDNRLNEITERASADKREAEALGKKYEEKYKQVAEIASKLTVEEAKFRDIQERKVELQQAIVKMEQGGSADGILQVRAERIQSDLEELFRALAERCKKHGIDVKSIAMVQLPTGWQPGIPEGAALWDEDWDKFEDEGFANDLTFKSKNVSSQPKPAFTHGEQDFPDDNSVIDSPVNANGKHESFTNGDYEVGDESYAHSEDGLARSPQDSPAARTTVESPSAYFNKSPDGDAETHRSFDESTWGAFDNNDDADSVWNFNPNSKDSNFGINPVRTGSTFHTKSPFTFDESVPGTPLSKFGNSPRYSEAGDFDMSGFDSFSMHESSGYSPQPERFTRFDSISSSKDFGYGNDTFQRFDSMSSSKDFGLGNDKFQRFDSMSSSKDYGFGNDKFQRFDSISSSKDFGFGNDKFTRTDSMSSTKDFGYNPERLTRFDSMSSSKDFGFGREGGHARFDSFSSSKDFGQSSAFSFDESDPFGSSGPFKVSSDHSPTKKSSDNWSAF